MGKRKRLQPKRNKRRCPKPCGKAFRPMVRTQVHCTAKCRNRAAQSSYRERQRKLKKAA